MGLSLEQYQTIKCESEEKIRRFIETELADFNQKTGVLVKDISLDLLQQDVTTLDELTQSDVLIVAGVSIYTER